MGCAVAGVKQEPPAQTRLNHSETMNPAFWGEAPVAGGIMHRAVVFALFASSALIAGAAQAQQVCCVAPPPPDGLRGPQAYGPPPYGQAPYGQPQYAPPQYAQPQYGPQQNDQRQYAPPEYDPRPASAASGLRGYVGVEYGKSRLNSDTPSPRVETWTGEGAVSGAVGGFGVQGDLKVANYNTLDSSDDEGTVWSPTLHVYQRNAYGLIGGWTGWSHTQGADLFGIGVEGQAYMGGATLYGSAGYGHVGSGQDRSLWTARLEGRYFVTENLALNLHGGWVWNDAGGANSTVRTIGVGAEYQPSVVPFSIQAGYSHADASQSTAENDTIRLGLRWNFGGGTLAERDRLGPSLDNISDLVQSN
jgi:hypothetical protein